jgi:hypothetical protein
MSFSDSCLLSRDLLGIVEAGVKQVSPANKEAFYIKVADELAGNRAPTREAVWAAVDSALRMLIFKAHGLDGDLD